MEEGAKGSLPSQVHGVRCSDACLPHGMLSTQGVKRVLSEHVARRTSCSVNHIRSLESYLVVHTYTQTRLNFLRSNGGQATSLPHTKEDPGSQRMAIRQLARSLRNKQDP